MALQQFVKQMTKPVAEPALSKTSESELILGEMDRLDDAVEGQRRAAPELVQSDKDGRETDRSVINAPSTLSEQDCETMIALAAVQIRYGRPQEAIPYLMMIRRHDPINPEACRLLALAMMKMGNWEQAEIIMNDLHDEPGTPTSRILLLYRGIVSFKQRKLDAARGWLQRFRNYVSGSMS